MSYVLQLAQAWQQGVRRLLWLPVGRHVLQHRPGAVRRAVQHCSRRLTGAAAGWWQWTGGQLCWVHSDAVRGSMCMCGVWSSCSHNVLLIGAACIVAVHS